MNENDNLNLESLRTTRQILRHSIAAVSGNIAAVVLLSFLIFSFRTAIEDGTSFVTSFVDKDPSLRSLLSRLDLAAGHRSLRRDASSSSSSSSSSSAAAANLRRRPFLHLTRVGTLDDDFFSGDDVDDRTLLGSGHGLGSNLTAVSISAFGSKLGFSDFVVDNGVRVSEVVRHGVNFRAEDIKPAVEIADSDPDSDRSDGEINKNSKNNFVDLQFIVKGLELGRKDAAMLFFLVSFLSAAYGWVILGFLVTYSWVLGIVFISVVNDLLSRFCSFAGLVWDGSRLGLKRLSGFILMRWAVRDAFTQLLGLWYFGEIEDQYSFFKLFVRLKLMPFSVMSPWIRGYEKEVSGFLVAWYFVDFVVGLVFAVDAWIAIVDTRKTGKEIVKEGCRLISGMFLQAVQIKGLESFLCGSLVRWALGRAFGRIFAKLFQSGIEVYFMVVWLMFYFGARCKEANSIGRRFGRREIEGLLDGLR